MACCVGFGAFEFEWEAAAVFGAHSAPEAFGEVIAHAGANGGALILRNPETTGDVAERVGGVVAEKEAAGDGQVGRGDHVGIADESAEAMPRGKFEFSFGAVDVGLVEGDWEADRGAEELIVVGEIVDAAAVAVDVELELAEEAFAESDFVVVAVRGFYGQAQDLVTEGDDRRRAGDQEIFVGRSLEDAVVGGVENHVELGDEIADAEARADGVLIDEQLVMIPAEAGAYREFAETDLILDKAGLFEVGLVAGEGVGLRRVGIEVVGSR